MICFYLIFFVGSVLVDDWGQSTSLYQFMWKPKFSDIFFKGGGKWKSSALCLKNIRFSKNLIERKNEIFADLRRGEKG